MQLVTSIISRLAGAESNREEKIVKVAQEITLGVFNRSQKIKEYYDQARPRKESSPASLQSFQIQWMKVLYDPAPL